MVEAAKAPAMTGPQLTPDAEDSFVVVATSVAMMGVGIWPSYRMNNRMRMMIGIGIPRNQSRIPRPMGNSLLGKLKS